MKSCPWCRKPFGFAAYLVKYGSDTLIKHSASAHAREHRCEYCRKVFWVFYQPRVFKNRLNRYVLAAFLASLISGLVLASEFEAVQKTGGMVILFLFFLLPAVAYARYESVELKPEK